MTGLLLTLVGMTCLCLSTRRHHRQVFGNASLTRVRRYTLRAVGFVLVVAAGYACVTTDAAAGLALYAGYLTVAVLCIALFLSPVRARRSRSRRDSLE